MAHRPISMRRKKKPGAGDEPMQVTLHLIARRGPRRRPGSAADFAALTRVSRRELAALRRRKLKRPIARVRRFARKYRLTVAEVDAPRRHVILRGAPAAIERAFAVKVRRAPIGGRLYRHPARPAWIPPSLSGIVHAVLGLDERPRLTLRSNAGPISADGLFPSAMARLYGLTTGGGGAGQCIALIEPQGGYDRNDLAAACAAMNLTVPAVTDVNVGTGRNNFGADAEAEADKEVSLDVQVAAGVAPRARIAVYFTDSTENGLVAGLSQAVHDANLHPSVIVMTWGEPESFWPKPARLAMDAVLADAVRLGITGDRSR